MAKKGTKRNRRTAEQMIADLKRKIEEVESRAAAKELKQSASIKRTISIVRSIDKAMTEAKEEGLSDLRTGLLQARGPLEEFLTGRGVKMPKARGPRARKTKAKAKS